MQEPALEAASSVLAQLAQVETGHTVQLLIIEGSLNSKLPTIWRVQKQMKSR